MPTKPPPRKPKPKPTPRPSLIRWLQDVKTVTPRRRPEAERQAGRVTVVSWESLDLPW
jgi:hypothetical protein